MSVFDVLNWTQLFGGVHPGKTADASGDIAEQMQWLTENLGAQSWLSEERGWATPFDPDQPFGPLASISGIQRTTAALSSVGQAIPFWIPKDVTITQMGWLNGSIVSASPVTIGLYNRSLTRLLTDSEAQSGVGAWQWINITNYAATKGLYWFAIKAASGSSDFVHLASDLDPYIFEALGGFGFTGSVADPIVPNGESEAIVVGLKFETDNTLPVSSL